LEYIADSSVAILKRVDVYIGSLSGDSKLATYQSFKQTMPVAAGGAGGAGGGAVAEVQGDLLL
jgi:hypothetical protein